MRRMILRAALMAGVSLAASTPAFAHAHLHGATPGVGSTVAVAPAEITCSFTEELEPRFSSIVVTDAAGKRVDRGDMHLAPGDAKQAMIGLTKLTPGVYTVTWQATSVDTHRTQGSYIFTVAPAAP